MSSCVAEEQSLHYSPAVTSTEIFLAFFRQIFIDYKCLTLLQLYFVQTNHFPKLKEGSQIPTHGISVQTTIKYQNHFVTYFHVLLNI